MLESYEKQLARWKLKETLKLYPGLRLVPNIGEDIVLQGLISFSMALQEKEEITEAYEIKILLPHSFPSRLPQVWEMGGRILKTHHQFINGALCLAAPMDIVLQMARESSLPNFIEKFVIPYLYQYSYLRKFGEMPGGELKHGEEGIHQYLCSVFKVDEKKAASAPLSFVHLVSCKKRIANKLPCACGSKLRLGKCHNRYVNRYRNMFGSSVFRRYLNRV